METFVRNDCKCWWESACRSAGVAATSPWFALIFASQASREASSALGRMPSSFERSCWQNHRAPRLHLYSGSISQGGCRRGLHTAWACISRLSPRYGSVPVITWKSITPKLQMSLFSLNEPLNISGDMYEGVPPTRVLRRLMFKGLVPVPIDEKGSASVSLPAVMLALMGSAAKTSAMPKSASMACTGSFSASSGGNLGAPTRSTLSHLRSLWTTPTTSWA
mmetsp:Transcript_15585/g.44764  ORF Transcript_15585/g.44764 Transcript_15585/m.44764 type:complete len:221 (+) Transcript_15585:143-805(+)